MKAARRSSASVRLKPQPDSDTDSKLEIGTRLKHARLTKGMNLLQLAEKVGCTESFLSKVEHDKVRPSLMMLHKIVAALEMVSVLRQLDEPAS